MRAAMVGQQAREQLESRYTAEDVIAVDYSESNEGRDRSLLYALDEFLDYFDMLDANEISLVHCTTFGSNQDETDLRLRRRLGSCASTLRG
jgi:hypothetical protein